LGRKVYDDGSASSNRIGFREDKRYGDGDTIIMARDATWTVL